MLVGCGYKDELSSIDNTINVLVANLKPLHTGHYYHVGGGLYPFKLP